MAKTSKCEKKNIIYLGLPSLVSKEFLWCGGWLSPRWLQCKTNALWRDRGFAQPSLLTLLSTFLALLCERAYRSCEKQEGGPGALETTARHGAAVCVCVRARACMLQVPHVTPYLPLIIARFLQQINTLQRTYSMEVTRHSLKWTLCLLVTSLR